MRPTAVHKTDRLAELVCSNSFRGDKLDNAVGLLKEEMRILGSLVMRASASCALNAQAAATASALLLFISFFLQRRTLLACAASM